MSAVEAALGEAYSEPAADVRGFVAQVKGERAFPGVTSRSGTEPWGRGLAG